MSKKEQLTTTPHDVVCCYHANCMDGLIAAAIVHHHFEGKVECVAVRYNEVPPLELMKDKHVYLVDFTYPVEVLQDHIGSMKSLTIIDHHADAMKPWLGSSILGEFPELTVLFNNERSGASLVWEFFSLKSSGGAQIPKLPKLVEYAQEYDLWTKRLPMTDEVQSALRFKFPPHEAKLAELANFLLTSDATVIEELKLVGSVIQQQEKTMAESLIRRGLHFTKFLDYENIPVCMMPAELVNQAGEIIYTRYPDAPFVVLFEDNYKYKSRKYSFRSRRDGGANVSQIAARLGGKGHYNSSGATVDMNLVFEAEATHDIVNINQ
jgi:oligoribonuclease NrnB/cAMP/cGMP phosphodiesterase (DHH superfamily)